MKYLEHLPCPCSSGKDYADCCHPFHQGKQPPTALLLMRARYAAYALCFPTYIIQTTHPANPNYQSDKTRWEQEISHFCHATQFNKLEIIDSHEEGTRATVTFIAYLSQNDRDVSFREKSDFEKMDGKWLYRSGLVQPL